MPGVYANCTRCGRTLKLVVEECPVCDKAAPTPQDGPENSVQQLYGKMPKACLECPVSEVCLLEGDYNCGACASFWRGLFRHFAV